MAWLGEALPEVRQQHATPFSPRTVKDEIEEQLFARRRDLFTDLSVVFMDTTSLSFTGAGGQKLGARGHSKDHRPDLNQMIVGVVIDADGRPVCSEMWPGNTADVSGLMPVIDRLRHRFGIGRVCVVADRGMISAATIAALEERGLNYVLGVRERTEKLVRKLVLDDSRPFTPLLVERAQGETQLFVKEVVAERRRYIVCRNEAEAKKDAATRAAVIEGLDRQLKQGDKALIGNSAYRRYLRRARTGDAKAGPAFEIDLGKLADEARFDGIFMLRALLDQPAGDGEAQEGPEDIVLAVLPRQGGEDGSPAARDTVAKQVEDRWSRAGNSGMDLVAAARAAGGMHSVGDDEPPGSESRPWGCRAKLS
jgi:hypothetical protein